MGSGRKRDEKKGLAIEQIALIVIFIATILITIIYQYNKTNREFMEFLQGQEESETLSEENGDEFN